MNQPFATVGVTAGLRAYAVIGCLAIVSAAGLAAPYAAEATPAPPAQLSISLTDGLAQVRSNTDVRYATRVTNNGSAPISAELVLSTPTYVTITHAPGAKVARHTVTWRITVRPGRVVSRPATAHIGTIAKTDYRVTTLASLYRGKETSGIPLIRTAVANPIVGVTDPAGTVKGSPRRLAGKHGTSHTNWLLLAGVPGLALVLLAILTLVWSRRRRDRRAASTAQTTARADGPLPASVATGRHHVSESD